MKLVLVAYKKQTKHERLLKWPSRPVTVILGSNISVSMESTVLE